MLAVRTLEAFTAGNVLEFSRAVEKIADLKAQGRKVGLCHGGFDLLHPGHIKHLESAKALCDVLFVSLTTDRFVAGRKGSGRPVLPEALRAYAAASIRWVDYVVLSDFARGVEVIKRLRPDYYIKGPDYTNKQTPGITAEGEAVRALGGEIRFTTDPNLSTSEIIRYIKEELERKKLLAILDRDGTLIENVPFLGRNDRWQKELRLRMDVVHALVFLKAKYDTTFIVVSNQSGVARRYFTCEQTDLINLQLDALLRERGIEVNVWKYCPDVDADYAAANAAQIDFDPSRVKATTERKPATTMVTAALSELKRTVTDFDALVVIGDSADDAGLARNLNCRFIDVRDKSYEELTASFNLG